MGNKLPYPSIDCLPLPSEDKLEEFSKRSIKYASVIVEDGQRRPVMGKVELPEGWGLFSNNNRGDIVSGYVVSKEGEPVAYFSWMSKGAYDNEASIGLRKERKHLNFEIVALNENGWFVMKTTIMKEYYELVNAYYREHEVGARQNDLDLVYEAIKDYEQKHFGAKQKLEYKKLIEKDRKDDFSDAMNSASINSADVFGYAPQKDGEPWIYDEKK